MHARLPTTASCSRAFPARMQAAPRRAQTFRFPRIFGSYGLMPQATVFGTKPTEDFMESRLLGSLLRGTADHWLAVRRSRTLAGTKPVHSMAAHLITGWFAWMRTATSCGT